MNTIVPTDNNDPTATVQISPEMLEVATSYLTTASIKDTAEHLDLSENTVAEYLQKREVRAYIDTMFLEVGYRNRFTLGKALDKVIEDKLEEMADAETTSSKDIAELLALASKFRKDELEMQLKLMKAEDERNKIIQNTINIQDNSIEGSNYGNLLEKLIKKP